jgi:hypothetical protein
MKLSRLLLAATLLAIAACSSPAGLKQTQVGCTLDPEDGDMVCPVVNAQQ